MSYLERLKLPPDEGPRMLSIVSASWAYMKQRKAAWCRLKLNGPTHLRVQFGHNIVLSLEGHLVWLALDEAVLGEEAERLGSWQWDEPALWPKQSKEKAYPRYKRPPSRNGFYDPSKDPEGRDWPSLARAHRAYLDLSVEKGRAPDHRTQSDAALEAAIEALEAPALAPQAPDTAEAAQGLAEHAGNLEAVPRAEAYVRALKQLGDRVTPQDRAMLQVHFHAPRREATATQIAGWAFVSGGVPMVNQRYGTLGRALAETLGLVPSSRSDGTRRWWTVWSRGWKAPHGFVWQMRPEVAEALDTLGWVPPLEPVAVEETAATDEKLTEGASMRVVVNAYERNPHARRRCIEHHGSACCICGFDFGKVYGAALAGFIHVHHLRALSDIKSEYAVNPVEDLRPVCPNCHAALHAGGDCRSIEEVRRMMGKG